MLLPNNPAEKAALEEMGAVLATGDGVRAMLEAFGGRERCLMRFLRARQLKASAAAEAFRGTLSFRSEQCELLGPALAERVRQDGIADWWPGIFGGLTPDGSVVSFCRYRCMDAKELTQRFDDTQLSHFYLAWMERSLELQREAVSSAGQCPGAIDIYDMEGVTWSQMTAGLRLLSGVTRLAQAHYPENLRKAYVINAPSLFAGAWKLFARALGERTRQKFVISKGACRQELEVLLGGEPGGGGADTGGEAAGRMARLSGRFPPPTTVALRQGRHAEEVPMLPVDGGEQRKLESGGADGFLESNGRCHRWRLLWEWSVSDNSRPLEFGVERLPIDGGGGGDDDDDATSAAATAGGAGVSRSCACIGSPCLRYCGHGASIGGGCVGPGVGGGAGAARRQQRAGVLLGERARALPAALGGSRRGRPPAGAPHAAALGGRLHRSGLAGGSQASGAAATAARRRHRAGAAAPPPSAAAAAAAAAGQFRGGGGGRGLGAHHRTARASRAGHY
jgi:hypothetical protein